MSSTAVSKFDLFTEQPPTPPRDISKVVDDAISFLNDDYDTEDTRSKLPDPVDDPAHSTPSSSQDLGSTAAAIRRVDFSPHLQYHKVAAPGLSSSPQTRTSKRLPSSKDARPLKSILKQSEAPPPTPDELDTRISYFSPDIPGSFTKMLLSVVQQLSGPSRSSRLDAYLTLNNVLRAYEDPPAVSYTHLTLPTKRIV